MVFFRRLLFGWGHRMTEGGKEAVRVDDEVVAGSEVRAREKRIRELERLLGRKTLDNEILPSATPWRTMPVQAFCI
jgi:transposase